jgi:teichuronic acid biosynthesis glycosyltransferase TuaG
MSAVGIIIPSYNSARFLPQTIRSIGEQTFADWKCVIVDDCSRDNSREVAEASFHGDSRFSLLALAENRGASAARNAGVTALGDGARYIIFLDSDDVWNASSLQILVDAMEAHPSWAAVYGNCRIIDHDGKYVANTDVEIAGRERFDYQGGRLVYLIGQSEATVCQLLLRNPVVSPGCLLIRSDVVAKVIAKTSTLFDPRTKYGEDLEAWLRINRAGQIGYVDQNVLDYRLHGCNISNRRWAMALSLRKVRLKALLDPTLDHHEVSQACAGYRAYRKYRVRKELRSAASCFHRRHLRATWHFLGMAAVSGLDILIVVALQAGRSMGILRTGGAALSANAPAASFPSSSTDAEEQNDLVVDS